MAVSLILLALFVSACGSGGSQGPGDETQQLRRKYVELRRAEGALAAEYPLAKEPAPYLVVDIPNRSLELKARGRSLRRFGILETRVLSGSDEPSSVWSMTDRRPLAEVERPKIAPGAGEQAAAEAAKKALWGPFRMPADFDLVCEGGDVLQIRALLAERSRSAHHQMDVVNLPALCGLVSPVARLRGDEIPLQHPALARRERLAAAFLVASEATEHPHYSRLCRIRVRVDPQFRGRGAGPCRRQRTSRASAKRAHLTSERARKSSESENCPPRAAR